MSLPPPPPRVLVVDDDEDSRRLVEIALRDLAVEVITCADSSAVVDLVAEWHPKAIVLDVMMPGLDGPSVVERLREAELEDEPKIVLWSAMDAGTLQKKADACGADAVVMKVAGPAVLVAQIREWLEA